MEFEWDERKRDKTRKERGLDFMDLVSFDWDNALVFDDQRNDYGEFRKVALGKLNGRLLVIAFTERYQKIRIISMRKANKREEKVYESF